MKKVFLLAAALVAGTFMFTSCNKDEEMGDPVISFNSNSTTTVGQDGSLLVAGTVTTENADAKLESVTISCLYGTGGQINSAVIASGVTKVDDRNYTFSFTQETPGIKANIANIKGIKVVAVVKDGNEGTRTLDITPAGISHETNLDTPIALTWKRIGGAAGTGLDAFGLEWKTNAKATHAQIKKATTNGATKFVQLGSGSWTTITTKAALKTAIDATEGISVYANVSTDANGTYNDVLGVIYNGAYYMIHITSATVTSSGAGTTVEIAGQSTK